MPEQVAVIRWEDPKPSTLGGPSAWHVNQGDERSRCPICNQVD